MSETVTETSPKRTKVQTDYRVFRSTDDGASWAVVDTQSAYTGNDAIEKYLAARGSAAGEREQFSSVPSRSWRPVVPKKEIKEKITLSPVSEKGQGDQS